MVMEFGLTVIDCQLHLEACLHESTYRRHLDLSVRYIGILADAPERLMGCFTRRCRSAEDREHRAVAVLDRFEDQPSQDQCVADRPTADCPRVVRRLRHATTIWVRTEEPSVPLRLDHTPQQLAHPPVRLL